MCGRFSSALKPTDAWLAFMQEWSDELFNRYNVSPASQIGAFVEGRCHAMRWGLVPSWSKEISSKYSTFNARVEGIEDKPAFRNAWKKQQKCLIPAQGYYEWQTENEVKQPHFVTSKDDAPLVFAGLWDSCRIGDGELKSCAIITTASDGQLKSLHPRMPVMLSPEFAGLWLADTGGKDILLENNQAKTGFPFDIYRVDQRVNNSREDDERLIIPLADSTA